MSIEVKLPSLGEGIDSGEVIKLMVKDGDVVAKDQSLLELGTDKASVEVPSSHAGKVTKIHVAEGQTIPIGAVLVTLEAAEAKPAEAKQPTPPPRAEKPPVESAPPKQPAREASPAAKSPPPATPAPRTPAAPSAPVARSTNDAPPALANVESSGDEAAELVAASPSVRRFAREVGVNLRRVTGTGPGGRITREDVLGVVRSASQAAQSGSAKAGPPKQTDAYGEVHVEPTPRIRKTIAQRMMQSWTSVPRVTNFDDADVTELERVRKASKEDYLRKGIRLTSLPFVVKSVAMAIREHPAINASMEADNSQVTYKRYVNIGIAVDTENGLVVPVLRKADDLSIPEIARELTNIAEKARTGSFSLDELRGATFTISNLGAIGGTYSTPIVNSPEVAILLLGRSRKMPVVVDDQIAVRLMMPLSLSYDHRLVDGATAARFLNDVIDLLESPGRLLLAP